METLKLNVFNFLNKSKKMTVPLVPLCPTFPYPQFGQFYKKVVLLRLSEHGDVIETQTIRFVPPKVFQQTWSLLAHHMARA